MPLFFFSTLQSGANLYVGRCPMYIYYTSLEDCQKIVSSMQLLPCTYLEGIDGENLFFAVEVGGACVPEVQHSHKGREAAVLFTTEVDPTWAEPEEVRWQPHADSLQLSEAVIVSAEDADAVLTK